MMKVRRWAHAVVSAAIALALVVCARSARAALFPLPYYAALSAEAAARAPGRPIAIAVADLPEIIRRVDNPHMWIAITFDACATSGQANGFDRPLFRVLQRERVPATIFTSGRWVEFHPAAMKELAAEPLIEFANHSYDHPHMTRLSDEEIAVELDRTEAALGRYGRQSVAFRPPFGEFNDRVLQVARNKQIPAVLWDVVSGDPSAGATADGLIRTVVRKTRAGSIVIFHINGRETQTASALPTILRQLRARGFEFVHLSTLLSSGVSNTGSSPALEVVRTLQNDTAIMPPSEAAPSETEPAEAPPAAPAGQIHQPPPSSSSVDR